MTIAAAKGITAENLDGSCIYGLAPSVCGEKIFV